jgi:hypothetical protein
VAVTLAERAAGLRQIAADLDRLLYGPGGGLVLRYAALVLEQAEADPAELASAVRQIECMASGFARVADRTPDLSGTMAEVARLWKNALAIVRPLVHGLTDREARRAFAAVVGMVRLCKRIGPALDPESTTAIVLEDAARSLCVAKERSQIPELVAVFTEHARYLAAASDPSAWSFEAAATVLRTGDGTMGNEPDLARCALCGALPLDGTIVVHRGSVLVCEDDEACKGRRVSKREKERRR